MNKIEYKHKAGEAVVVLSENRVVEGVIKHVNINCKEGSIVINYTIHTGKITIARPEGRVWKNKEELLKSL